MRLFFYVIASMIALSVFSCNRSQADSSKLSPKKSSNDSSLAHVSKSDDIIKTIPEYALIEKKQKYKTTAYDCRILPSPDSNDTLIRIPPNTRLLILDEELVQQGRLQNMWYKVEYNNVTGWTSGWNMTEEEELIVCSVDEMEKNYEKKIGKKPKNDEFSGEIDLVVSWLFKNIDNYPSIEYINWYEPYIINNYWNCRVEFRVKNAYGSYLKHDKIFLIRHDTVKDCLDK